MRIANRLRQVVEWIMLVSALSFLGGTIAQRGYDPTQAAFARAVLGGENIFASMVDMLAVWLGTLQQSGSLADVTIPEHIERNLHRQYEGGELHRQLQHARWLERFESSPHVLAEYKSWAEQECGLLRVDAPRGCHQRLAARLDHEVQRLTTSYERASQLRMGALALFGTSLLVFSGLLLRRRRPRWSDPPPVDPSTS